MVHNARIIALPSSSQLARQDLDRRIDALMASHPAADELSQTLLSLARTLREIEACVPGYAEALLRHVEQLRRSLEPSLPHAGRQ